MPSTIQIASDQAQLATDILGYGDPVVFLHAAVCDRRMWQHQLSAVGKTHTAVAYDRRGFGQTQASTESYSSINDLMAVLAATSGGKQAVLVGCSQGARVAIDTTLKHPEAVRALVLIAPSVSGAPDPVYPPEALARLDASKQALAIRDLTLANAIQAHLWLDGPLAPEGRVAGAARDLFLDMNGLALHADPRGPELDSVAAFGHLPEITVPTLLIWGTLDFPHIQARCRQMLDLVPQSTGHEIDGLAHLPSLEHPGEITRLIAEFLKDLA